MDSVDFVRIDLSRQRGGSLRVAGKSRFVECDFTDLSFRHSVVLGAREQSLYERCSFDRTTFHGCGSNVRMVGCTFVDANLTDWFGTALELIDCQFNRCRFLRSKFWGRPHGIPPNVPDRSRNEFTGNDFSGADLRDVSFAGGIDLSAQKLPVDRHYWLVGDLRAAVNRTRTVVARWADEESRIAALRELRLFDWIVKQDQDQTLIDTRSPNWHKMSRSTQEALLQLLGAKATAELP